MSNREEFIAVVNTLKSLSNSISDEQNRSLLHQAVNDHGISIEDAIEIINSLGITVGEAINYIEILELSIEDFSLQNESTIVEKLDIAHKKQYSESLQAGGLPRQDGRTQEQWRKILNQAYDTLKDPIKRKNHIEAIQTQTFLEERPFIRENKTPISEDVSLQVAVPEDMVLIPSGNFLMGNSGDNANSRETPVHTVDTDEFYIDKYPVTNEQFKAFVDENPLWRKPSSGLWLDIQYWYEKGDQPSRFIYDKYHDGYYLKNWKNNRFPLEKEDHPVTHVSWYAAMAYAEWVGKRLPTEAEWEKAARGGMDGQKYPWGDIMDSKNANCTEEAYRTTPKGKYPANKFGIYDMVGNTWEWCLDEYNIDFYSSSVSSNPIAGVDSDKDIKELLANFRHVDSDRVLRGGNSFISSEPIHTSARWGGKPILTELVANYSSLYLPTLAKSIAANIGFRCVRDKNVKMNS
ncbi:formylglycine-generating enzyme family protein [Candidatus Poribacteria bacterium]|nr:formylglycine-generating enzyme family protein [Candidatus Poribacteria bacterium]